jgi:hypothetical protein
MLSTCFQQGHDISVYVIPAETLGDVVTEVESFLGFLVQFSLSALQGVDLVLQGCSLLVSLGYELVEVFDSEVQGNRNGRVCVSDEYVHGYGLLEVRWMVNRGGHHTMAIKTVNIYAAVIITLTGKKATTTQQIGLLRKNSMKRQ